MTTVAPYLKDSYWQPLEKQLQKLLYDLFFKDIAKVVSVKIPAEKLNSQNDLIAAVQSGRIKFDGTFFSGKLNSRITAELRKFAVWDNKAKAYRGSPPGWLMSAITATTAANTALLVSVKNVVDKINVSELIDEAIDRLNIAEMMRKVDNDLTSTVRTMSTMPDLNYDALRQNIDYADVEKNIKRNIKLTVHEWEDEQTQRLRDIVHRSIHNGYNRRDMERTIRDEFNVSASKAKFWARQETSLFFSEERAQRFQEVGYDWYGWRTAGDNRVRDRHREISTKVSGRIYRFGNPPITAPHGKRNEPGQDYNCRCIAWPMTKEQVIAALKRDKNLWVADEDLAYLR
jgi:SPP1 gp7 family putative phage head morphogenesis protein